MKLHFPRWAPLIALILPLSFFQNCSKPEAESLRAPAADVSIGEVPKTSVTITADGALSAGSIDATNAFQQALDAAVARGTPTEFVLSAGTYRLTCGAPVNGACLNINGARGITIRGAGSGQTRLLVGNPSAGLLAVTDSSDIVLSGLSVDYDPLPVVQGTVTAVNAQAQTVDLALDNGFPDFTLFNADSLRNAFAMNFDSRTNWMKAGAPDHYFLSSPVQTGPRSWRVTLATIAGFAAGDRFALPLRGATLFQFLRNRNIVFRDILTLASPGLVTAWIENSGRIDIDGLQIRRTGGRLVSAGADAIHMANNDARTVIRNSYMEAMPDDAINTRTSRLLVTAVANGTTFAFGDYGIRNFRVGQTVQIVDSATNRAKGTGVITTMSRQAGVVTVIVDTAIPGLKAGDSAFIADLATPYLLVRDNVFAPFRGCFRLRGRGTVLANNHVASAENAKVFRSAQIVEAWQEGPSLVGSLDDIYFDGNNGAPFRLLNDQSQDAGPPALNGEQALLTHPLVFNAAYYQAVNPDLAKFDANALKNHWLQHGLKEIRSAHVGFSPSEYLLYADLAAGYGSTNYKQATLHYVRHGAIAEGRLGSLHGNDLVYDAAAYRLFNADLAGMSKTQLDIHWRRNGVNEGRTAHPRFSSADYLNLQPDLLAAYGPRGFDQAIRHYTLHGRYEGRETTILFSPRVYDVAAYRARAPDLAAIGTDELSLAGHWLLHGLGEGRVASEEFSVTRYQQLYPDVLSAAGATSREAALRHYVMTGFKNGLRAAP